MRHRAGPSTSHLLGDGLAGTGRLPMAIERRPGPADESGGVLGGAALRAALVRAETVEDYRIILEQAGIDPV